MPRVSGFHEVYSVSDRSAQQRIVSALRRRRKLSATASWRDGSRVVEVDCSESRAPWVFRKITELDERALLLSARAKAA